MEQILINIESKYTSAFLNFLKTLNYVEIKKVGSIVENIAVAKDQNEILKSITGAWQDERTTEEIIEEISASRHFSRQNEAL